MCDYLGNTSPLFNRQTLKQLLVHIGVPRLSFLVAAKSTDRFQYGSVVVRRQTYKLLLANDIENNFHFANTIELPVSSPKFPKFLNWTLQSVSCMTVQRACCFEASGVGNSFIRLSF